ncbi:hypothetical protein [Acidovorax sp. ACV01]|uniref:hypothetical protein n=1 Tax=Acidovorax sp. ACV01 TaxID=2769311 RepID=UPI00199A0C03|nr:hypothetical protein [Acidovorax sp. ACV01]MBD9395270.1 hypothetical protein [Acidovorax sp. ACV01]
MVRLTDQNLSSQPYYYALILVWKIRRVISYRTRKHGVWLWFSIVLVVMAILGGSAAYFQEHALQELRSSLASSKKLQDAAGANQRTPPSNELNIKAFETLLLPHEDIPDLVRSVLQIAEDEGLTIERGDYQSEMDQQGRFSRYKMNLPVKGPSNSIYRFMRKTLVTHGNITLDGLQFKREGVGSEVIEAKIQWIVLTKPPFREDGKSSSDLRGASK